MKGKVEKKVNLNNTTCIQFTNKSVYIQINPPMPGDNCMKGDEVILMEGDMGWIQMG